MRRRLLAAVMAATMAAALLPVGTIAAGPDSGVGATGAGGLVPTKAIVTFRAPPGRAAEALIGRVGGDVRFRYTIIPAMAVTVPAQAIDGLRHNPLVKAVELDGTVTILDHGTPSGDLEYDNAWGVHHIGTKRVHDSGDWGQGVKVAVIDSGIDYVHSSLSGPQPVYPEFNGIYQGGWDFVNNDNDPMDDNGHGTHVSGILAADKNGYLVVGMAPGVDLYALKVVDASGNGEYSSVIAALQWAVANNIDVVNMSIGGHDPSQALADAVEAAYQAHVLMVAAAGNVNPYDIIELINGCPVVVPAAYPHVLATTFTQGTNELTGYSCTGPEVDFGAPGDQIYSPVPVGSCMLCSPYGYQPLSGTSMASPHLAGLVALVLSHGINDANGDTLLFDEVKAHLCANTDPGGRIAQTDPRYPKWYGCGVIDAGEALVDNPPPTGTTNRPPLPLADSATTNEDVFTTIAVLANDSDPDGDPLSVASVTAPAHGTATIVGTSVKYTPAANWNGIDMFSYTASDGRGGSASAPVTVTVAAVNDPPVAVNQAVTTAEDTAIAVTLGATDPEGNPLTYATIAAPAHGTLSGTAPNVTYTPATNYAGSDSFTFKANDGTADSAPATVSITVSAANDAPVCASVSLTTPEDVTGSTAPSCTDVDGGALTYSIVGTAAHGNASVVAGQLSYAPVANYNGPDTFTYRADDGSLVSNAATVSVTVAAVNDPPVAVNDTASTNQDVPVTIVVLGNDSDIDGGALSITGVTLAAQPGATVVNGGTTVTYTPPPGYAGSDSFGYTIADAMGGSASATVSVSVGTVPAVVMHIGDLDRTASKGSRNWLAQVTVLVVDQLGVAVPLATAGGSWSAGAKGSGSCITGSSGMCTIVKSGIALSKASVTFTVTSVTKTGATYNAAANLETSITIFRP